MPRSFRSVDRTRVNWSAAGYRAPAMTRNDGQATCYFAPPMKRALCVLAGLSLVALAGCGGGDGGDASATSILSTSTTPSKLSKANFIEQGDAICAEVNSAIDSLSSSTTT